MRTAEDGEEGLAAVNSFEPDLIVSDIMMPRMNGYELARRIRENPQTRFIPIILQTAAGFRAEDQRLGSEVGALGFITIATDWILLARARNCSLQGLSDTCEEQAPQITLPLANGAVWRQLEREWRNGPARAPFF